VPAWHASVCVQAFPSSHALPSGFAGDVHEPLAGSQAPASRHGSAAAQTTGVDPVQAPAWQESVCVQAFPSSHALPSAFAGDEQAPVPGSQVPASWHGSGAAHTTGLEPVQAPPTQVSVCVHASPSAHADPSGLVGFEHAPLAGSQVPPSWHPSSAVHTTGTPEVQKPTWQVSSSVQASPSEHGEPSATGGCEQKPVPGSQAPASWHASSATHTTGSEPVQAPARHASLCVQAFPSVQAAPSGFAGDAHAPVAGSQTPASWH
jgi:hypothetical protein